MLLNSIPVSVSHAKMRSLKFSLIFSLPFYWKQETRFGLLGEQCQGLSVICQFQHCHVHPEKQEDLQELHNFNRKIPLDIQTASAWGKFVVLFGHVSNDGLPAAGARMCATADPFPCGHSFLPTWTVSQLAPGEVQDLKVKHANEEERRRSFG